MAISLAASFASFSDADCRSACVDRRTRRSRPTSFSFDFVGIDRVEEVARDVRERFTAGKFFYFGANVGFDAFL